MFSSLRMTKQLLFSQNLPIPKKGETFILLNQCIRKNATNCGTKMSIKQWNLLQEMLKNKQARQKKKIARFNDVQ